MKKLLFSLILLILAACTSTEEKNVERMTREGDPQWWQEIGEPDSEYWWVNEYEDEQSE
ncbi:hypothetical protein PM10SUCC1_09310 [Propionigenium maris DSM 9537]|uniref:Lipoprotein n=1 Tax=Propionigenium maris DSM 9537 TaxID=1123000 RepID=A0A9W6GJS4_9FUSO|nr:hypothetical protein [Propionigenium maris]GLI55417.1 hypothetical protein PM10SUCC1_09310 [Propionigenium maris DSM 9537]